MFVSGVSGVSGGQEGRKGKRKDNQVMEGEECGGETSAIHREGGEAVVSSRFEGLGEDGATGGQVEDLLGTVRPLCVFGGSRRQW